MRPTTRKLIGLGVLAVLVAWFVFYLVRNRGDFRSLTVVSPVSVVALVIVETVVLALNGLILTCLVRPFGVRVGLWESFRLSIISSFYNLITPFRGGAAVRAAYLKRRYGFSIAHFMSTLAGMYVWIFLVNSSIGLCIVVLNYALHGVFDLAVFLVLFGLFVLLIGFSVLSPKVRADGALARMVNGWHRIRTDRVTVSAIAAITLAQFFLVTAMVLLEMKAFGLDPGAIGAMLIAVVGTLSLLLSLTPGSLGIKEAFIVYSARVVGVSTAGGVAVALLDRAVFMLIVLGLGPIFSYVMVKGEGRRGRTASEGPTS